MSVARTFKAVAASAPLTSFSVPNAREPEIGVLLSRMSDCKRIYDALCHHPDITIKAIEPSEDKYLISYAEDTVSVIGFATQEVAKLELERRRRLSLYAEDASFRRYDISFKDALKSDRRREWAENSTCLRSGEQEILKSVAQDIPQVMAINPNNFRVSSICITARSSYDIIHRVGDNAVIIEVANDACAFTTPHADRLLGYRKEVELEIKEVLLADPREGHPDGLNSVIDQSMASMHAFLAQVPLKGSMVEAVNSKVKHANLLVADEYSETVARHHGMTGLEWALLQNVQAFHFTAPEKRQALLQLAETIPSPLLLTPTSDHRRLKGFFPDETIFPSFHTFQPKGYTL